MSVSPSSVLSSAAQFDIVAIAASAGGIKALAQLLPQLPADFAAAIVIVIHIDPNMTSLLPQVLKPMTPLIVKDANPGESLQAGTIYTAPPDHHLLIGAGRTLRLTHTAKVNYSRPAADCTLVSVAERFGERAIAVILTGYGRDGAAGIQAIKQHGGRVIVQEPATANVASMPQAAIDTHQVDWVLPLESIPQTLVNLVQPERI
ncbi:MULTISPECIES: chemotaxis protein CheB [Cyanophyceae]|uniref:chemotaxis protein CheB n=1 Tax=Cyanophyceae TaxID=3028117 RepID=UPI001689B4F4|nr:MULTISPECIES: chemotaxis protein CheB [Cyanophyceae]MBD1919019.1 chemotaxis protein CheB [Phormidium sp. FACHB-77]MBD2031981.1 chemotaxis protein CheB [Phormidium sp. FACHB-322]MBD2053944.1 chemotaxis protein CheB [Leptolyngbya sp. FACHB-60]